MMDANYNVEGANSVCYHNRELIRELAKNCRNEKYENLKIICPQDGELNINQLIAFLIIPELQGISSNTYFQGEKIVILPEVRIQEIHSRIRNFFEAVNNFLEDTIQANANAANQLFLSLQSSNLDKIISEEVLKDFNESDILIFQDSNFPDSVPESPCIGEEDTHVHPVEQHQLHDPYPQQHPGKHLLSGPQKLQVQGLDQRCDVIDPEQHAREHVAQSLGKNLVLAEFTQKEDFSPQERKELQFSDQTQGSQSIGKNLVLTQLNQRKYVPLQECNQRTEIQFSDQTQGSQSIGKNLVLTELNQRVEFLPNELNQRKEMPLNTQTQGSQSTGKNLVLKELNQRVNFLPNEINQRKEIPFSEQTQEPQSIGKNLVLTELNQGQDFPPNELNQRKEIPLSEQTHGSHSTGKNLVLTQRQLIKQPNQQCNDIEQINAPNIGKTEQMYIASKKDELRLPPKEKRNPDQQRPVGSGAEHKCDQCDQTFARRAYLNRHVESKHEQRTKDCPECGRAVRKDNFYVHLKRHSKNLKCDVCSKGFGKSTDLKAHMKSHSTLKPYQCTICDKSFNSAPLLNKHLKIHEEKKHICEECDKPFISAIKLKRHMLSHQDGKSFKCNRCSSQFNRLDNLKKHMNSQHQISLPDMRCEKIPNNTKVGKSELSISSSGQSELSIPSSGQSGLIPTSIQSELIVPFSRPQLIVRSSSQSQLIIPSSSQLESAISNSRQSQLNVPTSTQSETFILGQ